MGKTKREMDLYRIRLSRLFVSLEKELQTNGDDLREIEKICYSYRLENNKIRVKMMKVIRDFRNLMSKRDWEVLKMRVRVLNPLTLEAAAKHYGVTRERIRQIESRAIKIIRDYWRGKY